MNIRSNHEKKICLFFFQLGELLVVDDPSIALALSLSRYRDNFTFDPIAETDGTTVTIIETTEELPIVRFDRSSVRLSLSHSLQTSSDEVHVKTTTITTITTDE